MTKEEILKEYICARYGSVRQFALEFDLKYSTVVAVLSRGLNNSNIDTVFAICKALDIKVDPLIENSEIVENDIHKSRIYKRLEAYSLFFQMSFNTQLITIDDIPLDKDELDLFSFGLEALIDSIRKRRKAKEKEN